jgi:hypothetical protein
MLLVAGAVEVTVRDQMIFLNNPASNIKKRK